MQRSSTPAHFSHILVLPEDLIYHIFLICSDQEPERFPVIAQLVCKLWNNLALSYTSLWSAVIFDRSPLDLEVARKTNERLKRAQAALLDIHIFESAVHQSAVNKMTAICHLIEPLVERWRSLTIHGNVSERALKLLFERVKTSSAPYLQSFAIDNGYSIGWKLPMFRGGMPNLKTLHVSRCKFTWKPGTFANLTELAVDDPRLPKRGLSQVISLIRDILLHCSRLRVLIMCGDSPNDPPIARRSTLVRERQQLKHLTIEHLEICLFQGAVTDALLHSVQMPSLRHLHQKDNHYYISGFSFHVLSAFNPLSNLVNAYIDGSMKGQAERSALPLALRSMKNLRELAFRKLDFNQDAEWFSDLLTWLPKLHTLNLFSCPRIPDSSLRDMAKKANETSLEHIPLIAGIRVASKSGVEEESVPGQIFIFSRSPAKATSTPSQREELPVLLDHSTLRSP
ncbi:hypothetical protein FRB90_005277 [Tulasnella sp. 427]|nr:hypothetical protein FRB90_005277 [Tulasnella sp. 427]